MRNNAQALSRYSGGGRPGRNKVEGGREEEEKEEEESQKIENELMNPTQTGEPSETDATDGGVTWKAVSVAPRQDGICSVNLSSRPRRRIAWKAPR